MLLELIVIVALYLWLGLTVLVVVGCMAASRADARQSSVERESQAPGRMAPGQGEHLVTPS
jgi:hypothetical protein